MPLDGRSVVDFLIERGLLAPEDALDRALRVRVMARRNACFAVYRGAGEPGLFVKQPRSARPGDLVSVPAEAAVAQAAAGDAAFGVVARIAPRLRYYEPRSSTLVLDLVHDAQELHVRAAREGGLAPEIATALGRAVGELHRDAPATPPGPTGERVPWILSLPMLSEAELSTSAGAARELRDVARDDHGIARGLAELRNGWRADAFVHGDLKWQNVLVGDGGEVTLVDWELAGVGEAAWDVGGLLHAYLRTWIGRLDAEALLDDGEVLDVEALERVGPSVAALWDAYRAAAHPRDAGAFVARAVRFAGARLLQTAYESVAGTGELTPQAVGLAQLSEALLARPSEAGELLFGLHAETAR